MVWSCNSLDNVILGIAGNKNDLYEEEDVNEKEVEEFSNSINACFKLTSAKVNTSIDDIFLMLAKKFVQSKFMEELIPKYVTKNNNNEDELKNDKIKITKDESSSESNNKKNKNGNVLVNKCC